MTYFQGYGLSPVEPEVIAIFDPEERERKMAQWRLVTEDYASGKRPIEDFLREGKADHATDIIESMWGSLGKAFYVNTANRGAVSNMEDDAFLESRSDIDMGGIHPQGIGEMPRGILGLQQQVLDTHELTVQAAVTCDRDILLRAFMTDPIVNNISDARKIIAELLELQREDLPQAWYRRSSK